MLDRVEEWNKRCYGISWEECQLNSEIRKLWFQHAMWTRTAIVSAIDNLGDVDEVTNRLLRNPTDFAYVLANFYGAERADQFRILLEDHLKTAAEIIMAIKGKDAEAAKAYRDLWYANGEAIAEFLAEINVFWEKEEWKTMFYEHLDLISNYMTIRFNEEYSLDVPAYEKIEAQALEMAELMSAGIIRQFRL